MVGAKGRVDAQYTLGGVPNILIPTNILEGSGLCGAEMAQTKSMGGKAGALTSAARSESSFASTVTILLSSVLVFSLVFMSS